MWGLSPIYLPLPCASLSKSGVLEPGDLIEVYANGDTSVCMESHENLNLVRLGWLMTRNAQKFIDSTIGIKNLRRSCVCFFQDFYKMQRLQKLKTKSGLLQRQK